MNVFYATPIPSVNLNNINLDNNSLLAWHSKFKKRKGLKKR